MPEKGRFKKGLYKLGADRVDADAYDESAERIVRARDDRRHQIDWWTLALYTIATLMIIGYAFFALTQRACLARGFPQAKITITLGQYCIKRINQSDVVESLR